MGNLFFTLVHAGVVAVAPSKVQTRCKFLMEREEAPAAE